MALITAKRLLAGTAVALAVHLAAKPWQSFDSSRDYAPNPVQAEMLKLLASKHRYVGLGDTDHTKPEIALFANHEKTVRALSEGGVNNYFVEVSATEQAAIETQRAGNVDAFKYAAGNSWLCLNKQKYALNNAFYANGQILGNVRQIAADKRSGDSPLARMTTYERAAFILPVALYQKVYGCLTYTPFSIFDMLTSRETAAKFMDNILDDTQTAEHIASHPGKGVVFFGAGHFKNPDERKSMRYLLSGNGTEIPVVSIFMNAAQKEDHDEGDLAAERRTHTPVSKPDVIFYVDPSKDRPDGIEIINPLMRLVYEQARKNVAAGPVPGA